MKSDLLKDWQEEYNISEAKKQAASRMKFQYGKSKIQQEERLMFIEALAFWRFIFDRIVWKKDNLTWVEWMRRRDLLSPFIDYPNVFIRTIARIESMPTSVWQKVLWKYNIDFMSFESFLRRLSSDQIVAIRDNYDDLCNNEVPRAFSKWNRFWGKISVETLLAEEPYYDKRYANKGAMSYNLLGLDFGFNAYPQGVNDDMKVIEVSPLRFLSIKNHANDFVVNTEHGGKYWWLYRMARSNYVLKPNEHVRLNTHICPGFWYTIFVHLLFWVISPLAFMGLTGTIAHNSFHATPWWFMITTSIPGIITPLWLFIAAIKYSVKRADEVEALDGVMKFAKKLWKVIDTAVGVCAIIAAIAIGCFGLWVEYMLLGDLLDFLRPAFGTIWSILIMLSFGVYVVYKIYSKKEFSYFKNVLEYPLYFRIPLLAVAASLVVKFFITYPRFFIVLLQYVVGVAKWLFYFVVSCFVGLWNLLVMTGPMLVFMTIMPFAVLGVIWYLTSFDEEKQEKAFDRLSPVIMYLSYAVWMAIGAMFFISVFKTVSFGALAWTILIGSAVILLSSRIVAWSLNPKVKKAVEDAKYFDGHLCDNDGDINRMMLLNNRWYLSLSQAERRNIFAEVIGYVNTAFDKKSRYEAFSILLPKLTMEIFASLQPHCKALEKMKKGIDIRVLELMIKGQTFDVAVAGAEQWWAKKELAKARRKAVWKATKITLKVIFYPLILIFKFLGLMLKGIVKLLEYVKTLYRLYELFNERCPYVTRKEVLRLN